MYRLRMNRRVQAYRRYQDLERIQARVRWLNTFQDPIKPAHLAKAVTEKTRELFHAGAVSPKGCDDA
jgi:hypothetical protein